MRDFNRNNRSGGGRGFERRGFNDRGSRGPVEMHRATCDKCHQDCEVPFRPTSGKPIYCKNCFENNRGSESGYERRSFDRPANFESRQMFEAVCDECKNRCQVPFQPSGGKPVYCSNCFGDKKEGPERSRTSSQPQYTEQFAELNNKLDQILSMLAPIESELTPAPSELPKEEVIEEVKEQPKEKKVKPKKKK